MRIGFFVSVVSGQLGFENNVSGHIQVPLHGMRLLQEAGHELHLITNRFGRDRSLPTCLPPEATVHLVDDGRARGGILERTGDQQHGLRLFPLLKQLRQIKRIARAERLDVLCFFGFNRTAYLAGALRRLGLSCPAVAVLFGGAFTGTVSRFSRPCWTGIDALVTATEFVAQQYRDLGLTISRIPHGVVRDLRAELGEPPSSSPHRVLFWRDASIENGADVTLAAYHELAPLYPDIDFDWAIRPYWDEIPGIDTLVDTHQNCHLFRFPYADGITLPGLLMDSLVVMLPFSRLSIDPQLTIAESVSAGIPTLSSTIRSIPELIDHGRTGMLVPPGDTRATIDALDTMLSDPTATAEMGECARADFATEWNWDSWTDQFMDVLDRVVQS